MTIRFAHMADVHLGAFRDERLRELNLAAFERAIEICSQEDLDFVIISGDLFHVNLPEMAVVDKAVRRLRQLKDEGIRIYIVYGSHDYSAAGASLIDVLDSAALFNKVTRASTDEMEAVGDDEKGDGKAGTKLFLEFVEDETGALICGMPGRKSSLEKKYYEMLDTAPLEKRKGFKVFAFHSAITEFRPDYLPEGDSIPLSLFPKGFDYYAGGHIHERMEMDERKGGYGLITYPGTLFGYDYSDLERGAKDARGFYIVEHDPDRGTTKADFREVRVAGIRTMDVDCEGMDPSNANAKLRKAVGAIDANENVVLLKVHGQLAAGRPSDVVIGEAREGLDQTGAAAVFINRNKLRGAELEKIKVETGPRDEIEDRVFEEHLAAFNSKDPRFQGKAGVALSKDLLTVVRVPRAESATKADHNKILLKKARPILDRAPRTGGGGEE